MKVLSVDHAAGVALVRTNSGGEGTITGSELSELLEGGVYVVSGGEVVPAPDGTWTSARRVAVCRRVLEEDLLVRVGHETIAVAKPTGFEVAVNSTVELDDENRIVKVLDMEPISSGLLDEVVRNDPMPFRVDSKELVRTFADFGGFQDIKSRAASLILMPLKRRKLIEEVGIRPIKGVLFTGPPGTGKTLLAKILARDAEAAFFEVSGPEIFGSLYGESEKTLRSLFDEAMAAAPSIIFFDEIDSVASSRNSDSHEVSKRVVAQLLTLMDGFESSTNVLIIAATNRIDELDPALRRPGRFDADIEFRLPTAPEREAVLRASRPSGAPEDLPLDELVDATDGWSSAELASIWLEAGLTAVSDWRGRILAVDLVAALETTTKQHQLRSRRAE